MGVDSGRMEEIIGSVVAEVDVPTSRRVLASLDVIGTVGTAKLHVPKSKPVVCQYTLSRFHKSTTLTYIFTYFYSKLMENHLITKKNTKFLHHSSSCLMTFNLTQLLFLAGQADLLLKP